MRRAASGLRRAAAVAALSAITLLSSREALAWTRDAHLAIVNAARRLSPAFESRLPMSELELKNVLQGAAEADPGDLVCASHRGDRDDLEAFRQAAKLLQEIRTPRPGRRPEAEALLIGRYLHYAADCAAPRVAFGPSAGTLQAGAADLAIYREKRPLAEPLAQALEQRAVEAFRADPVTEAASPAIRDAVNLTIDAALLLPVRPGAPAAEDRGPTLFWIASVLKFGVPQDMNALARSGDPAHEAWAAALLNAVPRAESTQISALLPRGVHVVEWVPYSDTGTMRVLLFNNQGTCARGVRLLGDTWQVPLSEPVPPFSLKTYDVKAPASRVPPSVTAVRGVCSDVAVSSAFPAVWSLIFPGWMLAVRAPSAQIKTAPLLEGREVKVTLPARTGRIFDVEFDPAVVESSLRVMRPAWFVAVDSGDHWTFQVEGEPVGGSGWKRRPMVFKVEITDPAMPRVEKEIVLDAELTATKPSFTVTVSADTSRYKSPRFRVVSAALEQ